MSKINKVNFDGAYLRSSSGHVLPQQGGSPLFLKSENSKNPSKLSKRIKNNGSSPKIHVQTHRFLANSRCFQFDYSISKDFGGRPPSEIALRGRLKLRRNATKFGILRGGRGGRGEGTSISWIGTKKTMAIDMRFST